MKLTRVGWTTGFLLTAIGAPVAAQQGQRMGGMRGMMAGPTVEELKTTLSLDEAQQTKIGELIQQYQADIKEPRETMMENMRLVREGAATMESVRGENMAAMGKIRERRQQLERDIRALLTAEQQKAFDAWVEQQRQRMDSMRAGRPPAGIPRLL